jgi:hypothetical protein
VLKKRNKIMNSDTKKTYDSAVDNLIVGIGNDYENWNSPYGKTDWTKVEKRIRIESINKFKNTLYVKPGRKFVKVIEGSSVWGFVSLVNGTHKDAPIFVGDIMKAAGWRAPAKHSTGSIFDAEMHKSFSWTGPNYL